MLPDRVSNPGPLTYESGVLPIALRGPVCVRCMTGFTGTQYENNVAVFVNVAIFIAQTFLGSLLYILKYKDIIANVLLDLQR